MKNYTLKMIIALSAFSMAAVFLTACGSHSQNERTASYKVVDSIAFEYAEEVSIDILEGGSELVTVSSGDRYLLVSEGDEATEVTADVTVINVPVDNAYLAASAVMDMFRHLDAMDAISFSGTKESDWELEEARTLMERGKLKYAGKYSAPDYEMLVDENCSLAIENTMISHSPEVREQIRKIGIPVFVDYSSYEGHPLGRCEWIKVYGELTCQREKAEEEFQKQKESLESIGKEKKDGAATAFFFITTNGGVNIRKSSDYVPKMIELAGGSYCFDNPGDEDNHSSSETIQMESFYDKAVDADYLIYNSTIDGEIETVEDLITKSPLFAEFKAVREGRVYCTRKNFYQESMACGGFIRDLDAMYRDRDDMDYIYKLK